MIIRRYKFPHEMTARGCEIVLNFYKAGNSITRRGDIITATFDTRKLGTEFFVRLYDGIRQEE